MSEELPTPPLENLSLSASGVNDQSNAQPPAVIDVTECSTPVFDPRLKRWSTEETAGLSEIRRVLAADLAAHPYPDVSGDRKLLRFFRGHNGDLPKTIEMIKKFLDWRKANNVDSIRNDIINGMDHPAKFPKGEFILRLVPQIVIDVNICDKAGRPLCLEQYTFNPKDVLKQISLRDYIQFVTYSLEYKNMILEQLSEAQERKKIFDLNNGNPADFNFAQPFGVILNSYVIRDLTGIGLSHMTSDGKEILKAVIAVASDNYPELMGKSALINMPWVFNTMWYFTKGLLAARTIEKITVSGTDFSTVLAGDISIDQLPVILGGHYKGTPQPFPFEQALLCWPELFYSSNPAKDAIVTSHDA